MSRNEQIKQSPAANAHDSDAAREAIEGAHKAIEAGAGKPEPEAEASDSTPAKRGRGRKASKKAAAAEAASAGDAGAEAVSEWLDSPEAREEIKEIIEENRGMGKVDAKQAFRRSDLLARATQLVSDKMWKGFCEVDMGFSDTQARNFLRLQEILDLRERCIAGAVTTSILYELGKLPQERRAEIVAVFENGGRVPVQTVKDEVKALKNGGAVEADIAPEDRGGPAGLKANGSLKTDELAKEFVTIAKGMIGALDEALERHAAGKRVPKQGLAKVIVAPARTGWVLLQALVGRPALDAPGAIWIVTPEPLPEESGWRKVSDILRRLGSPEAWPASGDLGTWLADEVVPALHWAAGTKPKAVKEKPEAGKAAKPKRAARKAKPKANSRAKSQAKSEVKPETLKPTED